MIVLLVAVALVGLAVGSFLNVVVHRVPAGLSVVRPGSHCPECDSAIRARHNVPVLGWLMLRGRCADCSTSISIRYPIVEAATALVFVALAWQAVRMDMLPALPAFLIFAAAGITLTAIDLDQMLLPNKIVYPTLITVFVLFIAATIVSGYGEPLLRAVLSAATLGAFFFAIAFASGGGVGLGDVKLATIVGAVLGFVSYPAVIVGVFLAFVTGGLVGAALILVRGAGRKTAIPFGPSLVAGSIVAIFISAPVTSAYAAITHLA